MTGSTWVYSPTEAQNKGESQAVIDDDQCGSGEPGCLQTSRWKSWAYPRTRLRTNAWFSGSIEHTVLAFKVVLRGNLAVSPEHQGLSFLKHKEAYVGSLEAFTQPIYTHCDWAIIYSVPRGAAPAGVRLHNGFPPYS